MSHFSGHFEGAKTYLTPLKMSLEMAQKVIVPQKKNYVQQFLKQRNINSYFDPRCRQYILIKKFLIVKMVLRQNVASHNVYVTKRNCY